MTPRWSGAPRGPWWLPLVGWIPLCAKLQNLGIAQGVAIAAVFFRQSAVEASRAGAEEVRQIYDAWADVFEQAAEDVAAL